jgi:O-antigen/teichoic acid export membrane protein
MMGLALFLVPQNEAFPISYFIYGQTIAYAATLLVGLILVLRLTTKAEKPQVLSTETVLSASLPFALLIFFSMISGRVDAVLLERINSSFEAGIYAMAFRIGDMLTMISYLFAVLLLPMFSRLISRQENTGELFGISFRLLLSGCGLITMVSICESESIIRLIYSAHTSEAAGVLPWTIGAAAMFSLQYTTGTLLTAGNKMKLMIVVSLLSLLINLTINIKLIPYNGAIGAAQAAFITQTYAFLMQSIFIHLYYHVWSKKLLFQSAIFIVLCALVANTMHYLNLPAHLNILAISAAVIIIAIGSGTLPIADLKKILSNANQAGEDS